MDEIITIRYRYGQMTIILGNFFPCSQKDLKKLLKIIELDEDHKDELIEQITTWIRNRISYLDKLYTDGACTKNFKADCIKKEKLQKNLQLLTEGK